MKKGITVFAIASVLASPMALADLGLGVKAGTLGYGVEGTVGLATGVNLRAGLNSFSYDYTDSASDIDYDVDLDLKSYALLLDWHPFAGSFKLTAGVLSNRNGATMTATPTGSVTIGNTTYPAGTAGRLHGEVDFKSTAPYAGIGWGNAAGKTRGLGFSFELGVLFQGAPEVTLTSTNPAVSQSNLDAEAREIEDDLSGFKSYPVVSFGLSYQF